MSSKANLDKTARDASLRMHDNGSADAQSSVLARSLVGPDNRELIRGDSPAVDIAALIAANPTALATLAAALPIYLAGGNQ